MDSGLKGKRVLITGSTRGIGLATAKGFAAEGATVAIGSRDADKVKSVVSDINASGGAAVGSQLNVADVENYKQWVDSSAEQLGGIDVLVHNVSAGSGMDGEKSWYKNFELDMMGAVRGCEFAADHLHAANHGSVVFVSSIAAVETFMGPMAYNSLKAAMVVYAKTLSQAWAPKGTRVNAVSPGPIYFAGGAWEHIKNNMPELYESNLAQHPGGRMGSAEDVANSIVFLSSPLAAHITGVNLVVDGGYTKRVQL